MDRRRRVQGALPGDPRARARRTWIAAVFALALCAPAPARAGAILDGVKSRGRLRCGVSEGIPGFSERNAAGRWRGIDADLCRAVAAAAVGDADRVEFLPLKSSTRFPALQAGRIDLLVRNTSWTLTREAVLKVQFPAVLFYDGQTFLVRAGAGITAPAELQGATVCVEKGTTHERNLKDYFGRRGLPVNALVIDSASEVAEAFFAGRCLAYTSDASQLAAARLRAPGGPHAFRILSERISKEALAPAVLASDPEWSTLVRWVLYVLILAEENGVTRDNVDAMALGGHTSLSRLTSDERGLLAGALGVPPGWAVRAVKAVGNYGEMYERNVGRGSPLEIERGPNRLWTEGGLLYAPPID
jgi:general L-amino acid transport system substrate-binding protein